MPARAGAGREVGSVAKASREVSASLKGVVWGVVAFPTTRAILADPFRRETAVVSLRDPLATERVAAKPITRWSQAYRPPPPRQPVPQGGCPPFCTTNRKANPHDTSRLTDDPSNRR